MIGAKLTTIKPASAASVMVLALETAWQKIRENCPEIPHAVIILASGTTGKQAIWGHHAPRRWHVTGEDQPEILISGEGLRRDAESVFGTLLHEAAHALAGARGIQDTSRQGRYHNKKFKTLAEELGITVEHDPKIGWSITTVPTETATRYAAQIQAIKIAMTLWRHAENQQTGGAGRRNTNFIAAVCDCDRSIRTAASTLADAPIICGACDSKFQPKDSS
jgi:hypothetical protein